MTRTYYTRPEVEGYDALTSRGLMKFLAAVVLIFGASLVADALKVGPQLRAAVQLAWIALGVRVIWLGTKALKTSESVPGSTVSPRYGDRSFRAVPPRIAGAGEILLGALLILIAASRIIEVLSE